MKKLIFLTVLVSLIFISGNRSFGSASGEDSNWKRANSTGNVDFSYKISECNGEKVIFLKFNNKNDYSVQITWKEVIADKTFGNAVESNYGEKQLTLPPGVTVQDGCNSSGCPECLINLKTAVPTHPVDPSNLEFKDVTVSKLTN